MQGTIMTIRKQSFSLYAEAETLFALDEPPFPIRPVLRLCGLCRQIDHYIFALMRKGNVVQSALGKRFLA